MIAKGGQTRRHQKGSAVIFIVAWLVFAILALGAWSLFEGQAGIARMQARFQADAVARGAGIASRVYGPTLRCQANYGLEYLEFLHAFNGGSDAFECPLIGSSPTIEPEETVSYGFATQESQTASGAFGGLMNYLGAASRQAHVSTINEKNVKDIYVKNRPNVVLILDYSRSMLRRANPADVDPKLVRLRNIMNYVLDTLPIRAEFLGNANENFVDNVDLGLVRFAGDVIEVVDIAPGELVKEEIRNSVAQEPPPATNDVQAGTNYDAAFRRAAEMFQDHNDGDLNIVLFITDGTPTKGNSGFNQPYLDAKKAFDEALKGPNPVKPGIPLVEEVFTLFVGNTAEPVADFNGVATSIVEFINVISDDAEFTDDGVDFDGYFADFEFFYVCRAGPLDPEYNGFIDRETWAWVHLPNQLPGHPLEYTNDILDLVGDFEDGDPNPIDAVNSVYFYVGPSSNPNEPPGNWVYFTEFVCRKLEDENHMLAIRHGWSSVIDSSRAIPPDEIAMPVLP